MTSPDPIVTYDLMWEAANRLGAVYAEQVAEGGLKDPAVIAMREIHAEVEAIPARDPVAQRAKTEDLGRRYKALTQGPERAS